jgi:hypothetical protein
MSPSKSFQIKLLALVVFSLVMAVLLLYPAHSLNAQALDNPADQPKYASETAVDDALFLWQNESAPFVQKPDTLVNLPDDAKETQQFAHTLYLPGMSNEIDAANSDHSRVAHDTLSNF